MHTLNNGASRQITQRDKVALVQACWHREIVDKLRDSFMQEFPKHSAREIECFEVPGAFEIPLFAATLANSGKYAAVVAAGLVVDGGIYRHEFVATAVIDGLMKVQLESGTPVFSAVLTPHHFHAGPEHSEFFAEHFVLKGQEVAQACATTLKQYSDFTA